MAHKPVAVGVIGAGIMGRRMLNAIIAQAEEFVRLAGAWDPSAPAMERLAAELPTVQRFSDPIALIAESECLYIASPPSSHLRYARAALERGKTVFCEKPLWSRRYSRAEVRTLQPGADMRVPVPCSAGECGAEEGRDWACPG